MPLGPLKYASSTLKLKTATLPENKKKAPNSAQHNVQHPSARDAFGCFAWVSIFALIGNAISLIILQKTKSNEAHIKASMIFTSNDIIINIGVIVAGVLVNEFQSNIPDLVVGIIIFLLVVQGAIRILKLG